MGWVLAVLLLAGCLRSAEVRCDENFACPEGMTCVKHDIGDGYACATPDQVQACDDLADKASCGLHQTCYGGACFRVACNDHFIDPSEAVFVMLQEAQELEPHHDLRRELLGRHGDG